MAHNYQGKNINRKKMKSLKYLFSVCIILTFLSCNQDDDIKVNDIDYLIFGHFYGQCFGDDCVQTFKLTQTKLFEDSVDDYSGSTFSFSELPNGKFEEVKGLIDAIPSQLLNAKEYSFGCPDCADQGGIFIQYSQNGKVKGWRIDQSKESIPSYLHEFVDKVNESISLINK